MGKEPTLISGVPPAYQPYLSTAAASLASCNSPNRQMLVNPEGVQTAAIAYCQDNPAECDAFISYFVDAGVYSRDLINIDLSANQDLLCQIKTKAGSYVTFNETKLYLAIVACKKHGFTNAQIVTLLARIALAGSDACDALIAFLENSPKNGLSNQQIVDLLSTLLDQTFGERNFVATLKILPATINSCKKANFSNEQTAKLLTAITQAAGKRGDASSDGYASLASIIDAFVKEGVSGPLLFEFLEDTIRHGQGWINDALSALSEAIKIGLNINQIKSIFNQIYGRPGGEAYQYLTAALQACQEAHLTSAQTTQLLGKATRYGYEFLPSILTSATSSNITLDDLNEIMENIAQLGSPENRHLFATLSHFFETCHAVGLSSAQTAKLVADLIGKPGFLFTDEFFPGLGAALIALHDFEINGDELITLIMEITPGIPAEAAATGLVLTPNYRSIPIVCNAFKLANFEKKHAVELLRKIYAIAGRSNDEAQTVFAFMLENGFSEEQSIKLITDIAKNTREGLIRGVPYDGGSFCQVTVSTGQIYQLIPDAITACRSAGLTPDQTIEILGNKYFAEAAKYVEPYSIDSSCQHLPEILSACQANGLNAEEIHSLFEKLFGLIDKELKAIYCQTSGNSDYVYISPPFAFEIITRMLPEAIKVAGSAGLTGDQFISRVLNLVKEQYQASLKE
ncbi:MAG: hypothetical protein WC901_01110 [Candidatus Margulisiibacteriota bacterium]